MPSFNEDGLHQIRVMHVVAHLSTYGAENLVAQLAQELSSSLNVAVLTVSDIPLAAREVDFAGPIFCAARERRDASFFFRMVGLMRLWRPTIVHSHVHNGKFWGRMAAVVAGVPHIVHTEHNSDFRAGLLEGAANRFLHARTERFVAFSKTHATALAAAERIPKSKMAIIPNGIRQPLCADRRAARMRLGVDDDTCTVFVVGRFAAVKNQELAIRTISRLRSEIAQHTKLFLAGNGREEPRLRGIVADLQLEDRVAFLGFRPDLEEILPAADALLVTSLNEAMPLSIIEAMSARVPVVSTPWLGAAELLEDGALGLISADWTAESLADCLTRTFSDVLGTTARTRRAQSAAVSRYNIRTTAAKHEALYRALSGAGGPDHSDVRDKLVHDPQTVVALR